PQGPQGRPGTGPQPPVPSGPPPVAMDAAQADHGQPERVDALAADFGPNADYNGSVDYGAAADYAPAVEHAPAADQPAAVDYGSALEYGPPADYAPGPEYATPAPMPAPVPLAVPREDIYAAPVALPVPTDDIPGERDRDRTGARPRLTGDLAAYNPGAVREQYQRDGMLREAPPADNGDRLQPVPVALPGNGSAQVRRLPTRGAIPGPPNPGLPAPGLPPAPPDSGLGQPQLGGQPTSGQPTGGQPAVPVAPVVPMDYQGNRGAAPGGP